MDWLRPPQLDDPELADRAAITHFVLLFNIALTACMCIIYLLTPGMLVNVVVGPPTWIAMGCLIALLRTGRVALTGYITVGTLTVVYTLATFFAGGLEVSLPVLFTSVIVMGGLMISPRAGAVLTVYAAACTIAVYVLGSSSALTYSDHPIAASRFTTQLLSIIIVGTIVTWAVDQLRKALTEGRRRQAALTEALEQLERSRVYSESLIHTLAEAIIVTDQAHNVTSLNSAAMSLFEEAGGGRSAPIVGAALSSLLSAEFPDGNRGGISRADGRLGLDPSRAVPVQVSRSRLIDPEGHVRWVHVASDLRDRIAAEQRTEEAARLAEEANRAKSEFLANMSHELRTPLNAVIGYSEMLLDEAQGSMFRDLDRIHTAGRHLLHLINDVLDMSKIEAGHIDVHWEDVDVHTLVAEAVETVRPIANGNHTEVSFTAHHPVVTCRSDGQKLKQILLNLLSNAVKFTKDGRVDVHMRQAGTCIEITVSDTGIGIDPAHMKTVFMPFVQGDRSTQREFGGTGLGLALSQSFATMLGGNIQATSALGEGSRFVLTVPIDAEAATGIPSNPPTATPAPAVARQDLF